MSFPPYLLTSSTRISTSKESERHDPDSSIFWPLLSSIPSVNVTSGNTCMRHMTLFLPKRPSHNDDLFSFSMFAAPFERRTSVRVREVHHLILDSFWLRDHLLFLSPVRHLREDCGVEALRFFEQNLNEMSNSLIHRHCSSFLGAKCDHKMSGNQTEKKGKKKNGIRGRNKLSFASKSQDRTGLTSTSLTLSQTTTIYNEFTSLFLILLYFLIPRIHFLWIVLPESVRLE